MLIFEHLGAFKAVHDCVKALYPEIEPVPIIVEPSDTVRKVAVLEGVNEDKGKYKVLVGVVPDKGVNAHNFAIGLAQIVYRVKYGEFIIDALHGENEPVAAKNYSDIIGHITNYLNDAMFISNLIIE